MQEWCTDKCCVAVLTLSACTPPLPEVLILWDFLLAYGPHLNILCVVAQLLLMRKELLAAQRYVGSFFGEGGEDL